MTMDPVRGVSQVMDALRRTMSENIETLRRAGRLPPGQQASVQPARPQSAATLRGKEDLGPKFERASGHKLVITFGNMRAVVKRVQGGEIADVVIIPRQGIDSFVKDGKAIAGNVTVIARSGISVAVRKGVPKPDISSPEALKRTLLAARSITYGDPAQGSANGSHFAKVLDRLGIARLSHF
jgi:ABC-type molybdate transport system substrate-binding protein